MIRRAVNNDRFVFQVFDDAVYILVNTLAFFIMQEIGAFFYGEDDVDIELGVGAHHIPLTFVDLNLLQMLNPFGVLCGLAGFCFSTIIERLRGSFAILYCPSLPTPLTNPATEWPLRGRD